MFLDAYRGPFVPFHLLTREYLRYAQEASATGRGGGAERRADSGRADSLAFTSRAPAGSACKAAHIQRKFLRYSLFAAASFLGLLALCSRESACLWVILFLGYLFGFDKSTQLRRKFVVLLACLAVSGAYGTLRSLPEPRAQTHPSNEWAPSVRAVLMGAPWATMEGSWFSPEICTWNARSSIRKVFGAGTSKPCHRSRISVRARFGHCRVLLLGAAKRDHAQRVRIFGAAWFLVCYLPVSNIIDLMPRLRSIGFIYRVSALSFFWSAWGYLFPLSWRNAGVALACLAAVALWSPQLCAKQRLDVERSPGPKVYDCGWRNQHSRSASSWPDSPSQRSIHRSRTAFSQSPPASSRNILRLAIAWRTRFDARERSRRRRLLCRRESRCSRNQKGLSAHVDYDSQSRPPSSRPAQRCRRARSPAKGAA